MKAIEWFELVMRIGGVAVLVYGIGYSLDSLLFHLGYFNFQESSPGYYLINGLFHVAIGLYLIRGAPQLVSFAFPFVVEDTSDKDEDVARQDT